MIYHTLDPACETRQAFESVQVRQLISDTRRPFPGPESGSDMGKRSHSWERLATKVS